MKKVWLSEFANFGYCVGLQAGKIPAQKTIYAADICVKCRQLWAETATKSV